MKKKTIYELLDEYRITDATGSAAYLIYEDEIEQFQQKLIGISN